MSTIAIIPARGGSKRLERKNILPILGRPMLCYPVKAALKARLFDQVIVSTEDEEIKKIADKSGARVIDRPEILAQDRASVVQVCLDVLEKLNEEGTTPAKFCCIYATAVFITPKDLQDSFQLMEKFPGTDVVMGVSKFNLQPVQALGVCKDGCLRPKWPDYNKQQSQQHPKLTASNGTLYWADTKVFLKNLSFYPDKLRGYEIPWMRAIDSDTPEDYEYAKLLAPLLLNQGSL